MEQTPEVTIPSHSLDPGKEVPQELLDLSCSELPKEGVLWAAVFIICAHFSIKLQEFKNRTKQCFTLIFSYSLPCKLGIQSSVHSTSMSQTIKTSLFNCRISVTASRWKHGKGCAITIKHLSHLYWCPV